MIVCDSPFFTVALGRAVTAIRILSPNQLTQTPLASYLSQRSAAILGKFAPFGLAPTGYYPGYQTVRKVAQNEVAIFVDTGKNDVFALVLTR